MTPRPHHGLLEILPDLVVVRLVKELLHLAVVLLRIKVGFQIDGLKAHRCQRAREPRAIPGRQDWWFAYWRLGPRRGTYRGRH